ncbi:hypothetical protein BS50DRAFT_530382 [Corynespora cassiicola Philippines]|uniref:C2H2-type domain-containing protein n=1 Tax=Corynespora cassiicola Philippines TaxID=1448308 RepID=A0A2T2NFG5_CORCC|nr:hypothetical protein BS50DRAFT_530382 [Corynespora cassiicola Philippines]
MTSDLRGHSRKVYRCSTCDKNFTRNEHCIRHERSHTQERPFSCQFCRKTYARKDLVKRHERTIHADQYDATCAEFTVESEQLNDGVAVESAARAVHENGRILPASRTSCGDRLEPNPRDSSTSIDRDMTDIRVQLPHSGNNYSVPWSNSTFLAVQADASPQWAPTGSTVFSNLIFDLSEHSSQQNEPSRKRRRRYDVESGLDGIAGDAQMDMLDSSSLAFDTSLSQLFSFEGSFQFPRELPSELTQIDAGQEEGYDPCQLLQSNDHSSSHHGSHSIPHFPLLNTSGLFEESSTRKNLHKVDDAVYQALHEYVRSRVTHETFQNSFPRLIELRRFLSGYFNCFHRHLPIIHLPSLCVSGSVSPLVLAMCSIGALYRLERHRAVEIYDLARVLLEQVDKPTDQKDSTDILPLWIVRTRILLSVFALFCGETGRLKAEYSRIGTYLMEYRLRRLQVTQTKPLNSESTWSDYIELESHKRVLCTVNIISNLAMVMYDSSPAFVDPEDLDFEIPDEEVYWNAQSEIEWRQAWNNRKPGPLITMRNLVQRIVSEDNPGAQEKIKQTQVPVFSALVLAHGVCIHLWGALRFAQAMRAFSTGEDTHVQNTILEGCLTEISRCKDILSQCRAETKEAESESLLASASAVLRIAYTRTFMPSSTFQRTALLLGSEEEIDRLSEAYVASPFQRSSLTSKIAAQTYQAFISPVRTGHILARKTDALYSGVEYVVASWDSALFLSKWIFAIETDTNAPTEDEKIIFNEFKQALGEMDYDFNGVTSLAAAVAEVWSTFFSDVWVWGVAPKMGYTLERLAFAYQKGFAQTKHECSRSETDCHLDCLYVPNVAV